MMAAGLAAAADAGDRTTDSEGGSMVTDQDAANVVVDGPSIACDGALCDTSSGSTCAVAGLSPGRFSPSSAGTLRILGVLAFAALVRRSRAKDGGEAMCPTSEPTVG